MTPLLHYLLLSLGIASLFYWERRLDPTVLTWFALTLIAPLVLSFTKQRPLLRLTLGTIAWQPHIRARVAIGVGLTSFVFFLGTALIYDRALFPVWHDDQMHAVQIRLLSTGRLWTSSHPMADFFDTFHVLNHPVYAAMHFPGTALLNVASVWLHLPLGLIPLLLVSAGCSLTYLVIAELVGEFGGLIAVLMIWASPDVRMLATMVMSHNALLCLAPLAMWLYLRWRRTRTARWSCALGAIVGLTAVTRPVDAIAFALPIGIAVLIDAGRIGWRAVARATLVMCLAATPFLGLQLVFNKGVTGTWLTPPYKYYNDSAYPYTSFASERPDLNAKPLHVSDLPQKQAYYENFMLAASEIYVQHSWPSLVRQRLDTLFLATLPSTLLLIFLPLGLYGITRSLPRLVVGLPAVLLFIFYLPSVFFLPHYGALPIVAMAALTLIGMVTLLEAMPSGQRSTIHTFLFLTAASAAVLALPPFSLLHTGEYSTKEYQAMNFVRRNLQNQVTRPALVLFRFWPGVNFHEEPVYNYDTVNPDDSDIVFAHSLGRRNFELIRYFRQLGQNRNVYEVDRRTRQLYYVGKVNDLDRAGPVPVTKQP